MLKVLTKITLIFKYSILPPNAIVLVLIHLLFGKLYNVDFDREIWRGSRNLPLRVHLYANLISLAVHMILFIKYLLEN